MISQVGTKFLNSLVSAGNASIKHIPPKSANLSIVDTLFKNAAKLEQNTIHAIESGFRNAQIGARATGELALTGLVKGANVLADAAPKRKILTKAAETTRALAIFNEQQVTPIITKGAEVMGLLGTKSLDTLVLGGNAIADIAPTLTTLPKIVNTTANTTKALALFAERQITPFVDRSKALALTLGTKSLDTLVKGANVLADATPTMQTLFPAARKVLALPVEIEVFTPAGLNTPKALALIPRRALSVMQKETKDLARVPSRALAVLPKEAKAQATNETASVIAAAILASTVGMLFLQAKKEAPVIKQEAPKAPVSNELKDPTIVKETPKAPVGLLNSATSFVTNPKVISSVAFTAIAAATIFMQK
jgi:hypothetical protein